MHARLQESGRQQQAAHTATATGTHMHSPASSADRRRSDSCSARRSLLRMSSAFCSILWLTKMSSRHSVTVVSQAGRTCGRRGGQRAGGWSAMPAGPGVGKNESVAGWSATPAGPAGRKKCAEGGCMGDVCAQPPLAEHPQRSAQQTIAHSTLGDNIPCSPCSRSLLQQQICGWLQTTMHQSLVQCCKETCTFDGSMTNLMSIPITRP